MEMRKGSVGARIKCQKCDDLAYVVKFSKNFNQVICSRGHREIVEKARGV